MLIIHLKIHSHCFSHLPSNHNKCHLYSPCEQTIGNGVMPNRKFPHKYSKFIKRKILISLILKQVNLKSRYFFAN